MSAAAFALSAFGDEIADDLREQLQSLRQLSISYLELRGVWGKNVRDLDDDEVTGVRQTCAEHAIAVSCIGSPVGKSPIDDPIAREMSDLMRIFQIAEAVSTHQVRVFSFYPPDTSSNIHYDQYVGQATDRLARLADLAQREGFLLLLENEKEIVGDTPERCHAILSAIDSPALRFLWDPANFVQVGVVHPTERGWPLLGDYVAHVHVKDALRADGSVRAAGEGDGQVGELLSRLRERGYQRFLALEPHLALAGPSSGFSGAGGMAHAVEALRRLMGERNCVEVSEITSKETGAMTNSPRVTVWNEGRHEKTHAEVAQVYPDGIHEAIASHLRAKGMEVRTATLDEPEHGLTAEVLAQTDVLIWWGHMAHDEVEDEAVDRVHERVLDGMGLIVLHSGHFSKIFKRLMGTTCNLKWREVGEKERVWVIEPAHPIAEGLGEYFEIPHAEMYGERFDVPAPEPLVFASWFEGGELFRSGCCYRRGKGKIFYFRPGHETYPIFYQPEVLQVITNAVRWAAPVAGPQVRFGHFPDPLEA